MRKAIRDWWIPVLVLEIVFFTWLEFPVKTSSVEPPSYSAPVQILDENGEMLGFANAFLVDRELGLLVTNAHVVADGSGWRVRIGGRSYLVTTREGWINKGADLAILKLIKYKAEELPLAAEFSSSVYVGLLVQARGYKMNGESYCAESAVKNLNLKDWKDRIVAEGGWRNWLKRNTIRPGCSGSAVLKGDGKVVAIVSAAAIAYWYSLFIPSREIEKLLKRVRFSLNSRSP